MNFLTGSPRGETFTVGGIPEDAPQTPATVLRSRLVRAAEDFARAQDTAGELTLTVSNALHRHDDRSAAPSRADEPSVAERAAAFPVTEPEHGMDFLVLPDEPMNRLLGAVHQVERRDHLYKSLGLAEIDPHPCTAVNLHGPSGTGKTLAAHAVAARLGRRILHARYAQLASKFHGEDTRNLEALFHAAHEKDVVLFVDEADALLSRRSETATQGVEHAVNALRNQLMLALDTHDGLVIFATNLPAAYDPAFGTRLIHVRFPSPDAATRAGIWRRHLAPAPLPLAEGVRERAGELAAVDGVSGREIRRAVVDAVIEADRAGRTEVTYSDLADAVLRIKKDRVDASETVVPQTGPSTDPEE